MTKQKMTALVLDDQKNWRDLLADSLKEDFEVTLAESLTEAVEKLLSDAPPFDLVVTDLRLVDADPSNQDGLKFTEYLREIEPQTSVIVVTGYPSLSSAKQALGKLKVCDYLEKYPQDGDFDDQKFMEIARAAARQTRRMRSSGVDRNSQFVLVVEPDKERRKSIVSILASDGYSVEHASSIAEYEKMIRKPETRYSLVFMDDALLQTNAEMLARLQDLQPQARFITLAADPYADHLHNLVEKGVFQVIPVRGDEIDGPQLRKITHQALAPETRHYVALQLSEEERAKEVVTEFQLGQVYRLSLAMHNQPGPEMCEIWLKPATERREWVELQVQIFAAQMEVQPEITRAWEISPDGIASKLDFRLTPRAEGLKKIEVHMYHGGRFVGKMERKIQVSA